MITVHVSGLSRLYTVTRTAGSASWKFADKSKKADAISNPLPHGIFVIDSKSGFHWKANKHMLATSLEPTLPDTHSLFIVTGTKGAKVFTDITGDRIGKADWGHKSGTVRNVQILEKMSTSYT